MTSLTLLTPLDRQRRVEADQAKADAEFKSLLSDLRQNKLPSLTIYHFTFQKVYDVFASNHKSQNFDPVDEKKVAELASALKENHSVKKITFTSHDWMVWRGNRFCSLTPQIAAVLNASSKLQELELGNGSGTLKEEGLFESSRPLERALRVHATVHTVTIFGWLSPNLINGVGNNRSITTLYVDSTTRYRDELTSNAFEIASAVRWNTTLRTLRLRGEIAKHEKQVAAMLTSNKTLTELEMWTKVDDNFIPVCDALKTNRSLQKLKVMWICSSYYRCDPLLRKIFAALRSNRTLRWVEIYVNQNYGHSWTDYHDELVQVLKENRDLEYLGLPHEFFRGRDGEDVSKFEKQSTELSSVIKSHASLTGVNVNQLDPRLVSVFEAVLNNTRIQRIFANTLITSKYVDDFARRLNANNLHTLEINADSLKGDYISDALRKNSSLRQLIISSNRPENKSELRSSCNELSGVLNALRINQTLEILFLQTVTTSNIGKKVADMLLENQGLKQLYLDHIRDTELRPVHLTTTTGDWFGKIHDITKEEWRLIDVAMRINTTLTYLHSADADNEDNSVVSIRRKLEANSWLIPAQAKELREKLKANYDAEESYRKKQMEAAKEIADKKAKEEEALKLAKIKEEAELKARKQAEEAKTREIVSKLGVGLKAQGEKEQQANDKYINMIVRVQSAGKGGGLGGMLLARSSSSKDQKATASNPSFEKFLESIATEDGKAQRELALKTMNAKTVAAKQAEEKKIGMAIIDDPSIEKLLASVSSRQLVNFPNGDSYIGDIVGGVPHGRGVLRYAAGNAEGLLQYGGYFRNGLRHGRGIVTLVSGRKCDLEWVDGTRAGRGILYYANEARYEGEISPQYEPHGRGTYVFSNRSRYEGNWVNGERQGIGILFSASSTSFYEGSFKENSFIPHGRGRRVYPNSRDSYTGEFEEGAFHGNGIQETEEGRYQGEFREGRMRGRGLIEYTTGYRYEGEVQPFSEQTFFLVEGSMCYQPLLYAIRHGRGRLVHADRIVYDGDWVTGRFHGRGTYTLSNGNVYTGEFREGQMHGSGRMIIDSSGRGYEGEWHADKPHGRGTIFDGAGNRVPCEFRNGEIVR